MKKKKIDLASLDYQMGYLIGATAIFTDMIMEDRIDPARYMKFNDELFSTCERLKITAEEYERFVCDYCETVGHDLSEYVARVNKFLEIAANHDRQN